MPWKKLIPMPIYECHACKKHFKNTRKDSKFCSLKCFSKHKADGSCIKCYMKTYNTKNTKKHAKRSRERRLKFDYGITPKQWNKMYLLQNGKCPICERSIPCHGNKELKRAGAVDHDHKTKRVRGLVCHLCNRSRIGMNNIDTAKRLIEYLSSDFDARVI